VFIALLPYEAAMRDVYLVGVGMTRFAKQPDRNLKSLTAEAVGNALMDADLDVRQVEAVYFGNAVAGSITGQEMVAGQVTLAPLGFKGLPIFNIENACASASSALHLAWQAVASGASDVALAVGAEKMTHPDKARSFAAIGGAVDVETVDNSAVTSRSPFMDVYAAEAREYMEESGASQHDLAAVVVKNQYHGSLNPLAQYGDPNLTVEQVLADREIVWPLTLRMCSPISDGAAAAVVVSDRWLHDRARAVKVAASAVRANRDGGKVAELASGRAYEVAGVGPEDVDLAELHDAAAGAELSLYEQLGFGDKGGGGVELIRSGATRLGGRVPVNVSGGLLSRGHPVGATGLGQVYELVLQLRGEAGKRQVDGAKLALAENGGGYLDGDNAVAAVTILTR
jgi:acetyl-CoA acetyltransferase